MTSKPKVGSVVRVTTKHREIYHDAKDEWRYNTYEGVVVPSKPWHTPTSFQLKVKDQTFMPIIEISTITKIEYISGSGVEIDTSDKVWKVTSARDPKKSYTVKLSAGRWSCTCDGFQFRKNCRHINERKLKK